MTEHTAVHRRRRGKGLRSKAAKRRKAEASHASAIRSYPDYLRPPRSRTANPPEEFRT